MKNVRRRSEDGKANQTLVQLNIYPHNITDDTVKKKKTKGTSLKKNMWDWEYEIKKIISSPPPYFKMNFNYHS